MKLALTLTAEDGTTYYVEGDVVVKKPAPPPPPQPEAEPVVDGFFTLTGERLGWQPAQRTYVPAKAGSVFQIRGRRFGKERGSIAFDGRPLLIRTWTPTLIEALAPLDRCPAARLTLDRKDGGFAAVLAFHVEE